MAYTVPADVAASTPEIWAKSILRSHRRSGFWGRMVGAEGSGMPIIQKAELLNKPGDLIHISVTDPLSGTGVLGDDALLEGNEEKLTTSAIKVAPQLYRHAVRWNRRANKKNIVDLRAEGKMRLGEWGGALMDVERFRYLSSDGTDGVQGDDDDGTVTWLDDPLPYAGEAYTPNVYVAGELADESLVSDSNGFLEVRDIQVIRVSLEEQQAKPLRTAEGEDVFGLVITPNMAFNLKRDSEYQEYVKLARERAASNPLFTGAIAMIDGVMIWQHSRVRTFTGTHVDAPELGKGLAFGAEAFVEALDENPHSEEDTFDYGLHLGFSYEFAFRPRRGLEQNSLQIVASNQRVAT